MIFYGKIHCQEEQVVHKSEVSLLVAELRAIGGVIRLSMVELEDEGGEGESAKGKRGTPLRGGSFYHSPFVLYFHFPWLGK